MGAFLPDNKDLADEQRLLNDSVYRAEWPYLVQFLSP
jgi:hypothetical protein